MSANETSSLVQSDVAKEREERVRHLPARAREALHRYEAAGDSEAIDEAVVAIIEAFAPHRGGNALQPLPGGTRLIEDLGFDSLAISEIVFSIEDLFGVGISNQEIVLVSTLDDLRSFVRSKIPPPGPTG